MLSDEKIIPKSRLAPAAKTSREFIDHVVTELTFEGKIDPAVSATGRSFLSFNDVRAIWDRLGLR